ncbi:sigma-70 family RNA polymerase sigma factor [Streptomyces decoyicus]|uniref:sigma-70 family RNA polymerase sigma factor n=1 Tax=Streptomyces decoyicus TaxID=249567 RepID=UPI0038636069
MPRRCGYCGAVTAVRRDGTGVQRRCRLRRPGHGRHGQKHGRASAADPLSGRLRTFRSLHRFEGRSSARSWLLSIARRAVIDSYRYSAARPRLSDVPDWQVAVERSQPQDLPGFDDGVALLDLLASLPGERREAFILTQLLGLPYAEAAEVSDCPVGTLRSRFSRARATLMDLLDEADEPAVPA